jgi:WD40 repeat protein
MHYWPRNLRACLLLVLALLALAVQGQELAPVLQVTPVALKGYGLSAFSPDGSLLALVQPKEGVAVWETKTGRFVRAIAFPAGAALVLARPEEYRPVSISPDNTLLGVPLQTDTGQQVLVWNLQTGALALTLGNQMDPNNPMIFNDVEAPAFLPDGQNFLLEAGGSISLFSLAGQRQMQLGGMGPAGPEFMTGMVVSPDGKWMATIVSPGPGMDMMTGTVRIYDVAARAAKFTLDNQKFRPGDLRFAPDSSQLIAVNTAINLVSVAETATGTIFAPIPRPTRPDGKPLPTPFHSVAGLVAPDRVAFYGTEGETPIWEQKEFPFPVQGALVSPDGLRLAVNTRGKAEDESELSVWDIKEKRCLWRRAFREQRINRLVFNPKGTMLAVEGVGLHVQMISLTSGSVTKRIAPPEPGFPCAALSANAKLAAFAGGEATDVILMDVESQAVKWRSAIGNNPRVPLLFTPDGKYVVVGLSVPVMGGTAEKTRLINAATGATAWEKPGIPVGVTPDSALVAICLTKTAGVHFLAIDSGEERGALDAQGGANIAFAQDALVAGAGYDTLYLWAPPTARAVAATNLRNAAGTPAWLYSIAAAAKAPRVAVGTGAGDVFATTVSAKGFGEIAHFPGNGQAVSAVAFSPDGTLLACGTEKGVVMLRDAATGAVLAVWQLFPTLRGDAKVYDWLVAAPDGTLNCAESTKALLAWNVAGKLAPFADYEKTYLNPEKIKEALKRPEAAKN